ncbi:lysM domain-containing protein [Hirsutella rhossiliensis]|uniref:LysM domain-containing protein n=1 Tax=Hirsutella rhossiliensis TaxID=111463 RepID=A0A9P8SKU1_9HYPO|nr:lysM domain-containing protein [Hirsutella rhossiliensis]KAH0965584.1 lysM domain-containing protein [Hirsutella rhossiliensis]
MDMLHMCDVLVGVSASILVYGILIVHMRPARQGAREPTDELIRLTAARSGHASVTDRLVAAEIASVALAAPGGLRLGARTFSNTTDSCPYTVDVDDSCYFIAKSRFDIELDRFSKLNGGEFDSSCNIFPGKEVRVPCGKQFPIDQVDVSGECLTNHKVKAEENIYSISLHYSIAAHVLLAYNGLDWRSPIKVGQDLCVSRKKPTAVCAKEHHVVDGDNCYALATANNVNLLDLKAWNPELINDRCAIRPGHKLCVKADEPVTTSPAASTVQPASSTVVGTATAASQSTFQTSFVAPDSKVVTVTRVAPSGAVDANAIPSVNLAAEVKAHIKLYLLPCVGNLTAPLPAGDDDKVMLPSETQIRWAVKAFASVSVPALNGDAPATAQVSGSAAPGFSVSASAPASILVRLFTALKVDIKYNDCKADACSVVVSSPSQVSASLAAQAVVPLKAAGAEGDKAVASQANTAGAIPVKAEASIKTEASIKADVSVEAEENWC